MWLGLKILSSSENDDEGEVLFECSYQVDDEDHIHRERSSFKKYDGLWKRRTKYFRINQI